MNPTRNTRLIWIAAAALSVTASGCGDDHHHDHAIDDHACGHVANGPFGSVTAGADADAAPDAINEATWYTVSLPLIDDGPERLGYLALTINVDDDYGFFLDADVPLEVVDAAGTTLPVSSSGDGSGICAITRYAVYELSVGTHDVIIGPTELEEINLIVEELEDDGHHHHH